MALACSENGVDVTGACGDDCRHGFVRIVDDGAGFDLRLFETGHNSASGSCSSFVPVDADLNLSYAEWHTLEIDVSKKKRKNGPIHSAHTRPRGTRSRGACRDHTTLVVTWMQRAIGSIPVARRTASKPSTPILPPARERSCGFAQVAYSLVIRRGWGNPLRGGEGISLRPEGRSLTDY